MFYLYVDRRILSVGYAGTATGGDLALILKMVSGAESVMPRSNIPVTTECPAIGASHLVTLAPVKAIFCF